MTENVIRHRNPFLVIVWAYALFILMQALIYLGAWLSSVLTGADFVQVLTGKYQDYYTILVLGYTQLFLGIPWIYLVLKYLWRRDWVWMGFSDRLRGILGGLLSGLVLPVFITLILLAMGFATITKNPNLSSLTVAMMSILGAIAMALFTAFIEEVVFRGMIAREVAHRYGWFMAALVSGGFFGIVHLPNLHNPTIVTVIQVILTGFAFSTLLLLIYMKYNSLWPCIGLHAGWNISLNAVIGATQSGNSSNYGLFTTQLAGPVFISGGEFGLETSVISLIVYVLGVGMIALIIRRQRIESS